jgi:hypothetical protein
VAAGETVVSNWQLVFSANAFPGSLLKMLGVFFEKEAKDPGRRITKFEGGTASLPGFGGPNLERGASDPKADVQGFVTKYQLQTLDDESPFSIRSS